MEYSSDVDGFAPYVFIVSVPAETFMWFSLTTDPSHYSKMRIGLFNFLSFQKNHTAQCAFQWAQSIFLRRSSWIRWNLTVMIDGIYQALRVLNIKSNVKQNSFVKISGFMRPVEFLINTKKTTQTGWMKCLRIRTHSLKKYLKFDWTLMKRHMNFLIESVLLEQIFTCMISHLRKKWK